MLERAQLRVREPDTIVRHRDVHAHHRRRGAAAAVVALAAALAAGAAGAAGRRVRAAAAAIALAATAPPAASNSRRRRRARARRRRRARARGRLPARRWPAPLRALHLAVGCVRGRRRRQEGSDRNDAAALRELERVGDAVVQALLQPARVGHHAQLGDGRGQRLRAQHDALRLREPAKSREAVAQQPFDAERRWNEHEAARVDALKVEPAPAGRERAGPERARRSAVGGWGWLRRTSGRAIGGAERARARVRRRDGRRVGCCRARARPLTCLTPARGGRSSAIMNRWAALAVRAEGRERRAAGRRGQPGG